MIVSGIVAALLCFLMLRRSGGIGWHILAVVLGIVVVAALCIGHFVVRFPHYPQGWTREEAEALLISAFIAAGAGPLSGILLAAVARTGSMTARVLAGLALIGALVALGMFYGSLAAEQAKVAELNNRMANAAFNERYGFTISNIFIAMAACAAGLLACGLAGRGKG